MVNVKLSPREEAVLAWLLEGLSNKEIGLMLGISTRTVQKHLTSIYEKLSVSTRGEAVVAVLRWNRQRGIAAM